MGQLFLVLILVEFLTKKGKLNLTTPFQKRTFLKQFGLSGLNQLPNRHVSFELSELWTFHTHRFKLNSFKGLSYSKAALLVVIHILLKNFCCVQFQQTLEEASLANVDITCGAVAWLLFHVALELHKDVQKNLTVEVKNSISRGVCKYFSEYFFFC